MAKIETAAHVSITIVAVIPAAYRIMFMNGV